MDILAGFDGSVGGKLGLAAAYGDLLDRNDAVAAVGNDCTGHNFNTTRWSCERQRRVARSLGGLDAQVPVTSLDGVAIHGNTVHCNTIERRCVPLGVDVLAQHRARTLCERQ